MSEQQKTAPEEPQAEVESEPSLTEIGNRASVFYVISERFKKLSDDATAELRHRMLQKYSAEKVRPSVETKLPTGDRGEDMPLVTTWIIPKTSASAKVTDETAFVAFCEENFPSEVTWQPVVNDAFKKTLTKRAVRDGTTGAMVDPETGLVVEGLTHFPAPEPSSIRSNFPGDSKDLIMEYVGQGNLRDVVMGLALPAADADQAQGAQS
jgi:hypothetical protein